MIGWRAIEMAPRDGTEILLSGSVNSARYLAIGKFDRGVWVEPGYTNTLSRVTHWMPLPDAPDSGKRTDTSPGLQIWQMTTLLRRAIAWINTQLYVLEESHKVAKTGAIEPESVAEELARMRKWVADATKAIQ